MSKRYNLREYHRPTDVGEAKRLLGRKNIRTIPLAGGVAVVGEASPDVEAVVDLDGLGLDFIDTERGTLRLGAMVRLQTIIDKLADVADGLLVESARRTAGWHIRNAATVGGTLAGGNVHSPFSVALAALGAHVTLDGKQKDMPLWADLASEIIQKGLKGRLITAVGLSLPEGQVGASYQQVGRTRADHPIVSAAAVAVNAGNDILGSVAVGGLLNDLAVFTLTITSGNSQQVADNLAAEVSKPRTPESIYLSDFRGSSEYRRDIAPVLARRALVEALNRLSRATS